MLKIYQQTLAKSIKFEGIGLHSGKKSFIRILPASENQGIIFKRVDLEKNNLVFANYKSVCSTRLCTTLKNEHGAKISTVEHLLAALYLAEIDNAVIEINSEEVPIMDGSAKVFFEGLKKKAIIKQTSKRKYLKIINNVDLTENYKNLTIIPKDTFEIEFRLKYKNQVIGSQENNVNFQIDDLSDIYKSRTFCLYEDIEKIKSVGLAKGGSLENAVVVDKNKVMNHEGLRNKKEFVNHKILDLAGDFLLSGFRILGKVICNQGGHDLTNKFLKKMLNTKTSFKIVELDEVIASNSKSVEQSNKLAVNA